MEKTETNKKNSESKLGRLEEITVVLSPIKHNLLKVPLIRRVYSRRLKRKYKKLFPEYGKFIFE